MLYDKSIRKVELRFSASDLVNKDLFSLSDPFLVCHTIRNGQPYKEIGRTETVQDDLNPVWATTFSFDYDPSIHHTTWLVVDLFDMDSHETSLSKHDFLGRASFQLSELLGSKTMKLELPLRTGTVELQGRSATSSSISDSHDGEGEEEGESEGDLADRQKYLQHSQFVKHVEVNEDVEGEGVYFENYGNYSHDNNNRDSIGAGTGRRYDERYESNDITGINLIDLSVTEHHSPFDTATTASTKPGGSTELIRKSSNRKRSSSNQPKLKHSDTSEELIKATRGSRASKVKGTVSIYAENLAPSPSPPTKIHLKVRSALLKDTGMLGRRIVQFYEVQREQQGDWSCVYRSEDGIKVDKNNYVLFNDVSISESSLTNMQADRKLRICFYKRHTRTKHQLISYISTSLSQLRKITHMTMQDGLTKRNTVGKKSNVAVVDGAVTLKMEGEFGDDDGLGSVVVKRLESEKTGSNGYKSRQPSPEVSFGEVDGKFGAEEGYSFRADHFLNKKFISSLNDAPKHDRRIFQKPSFISLH